MSAFFDDEITPVWRRRSTHSYHQPTTWSPRSRQDLLRSLAALDQAAFTHLLEQVGVEPYHLPANLAPALDRAHALMDHLSRRLGSIQILDQALDSFFKKTSLHPFAQRISDPDVLSGRRVSGHTLHNCIGSGGSGSVYVARKDSTGKLCAFKVIDPIPRGDRHLLVETWDVVHGLNAVHHPSVINIFDFGEAQLEGPNATQMHDFICYFMTMELIHGKRLNSWAWDANLRSLLNVLIQIADGLAVCHNTTFDARSGVRRQGFFHGDIKPSNILVRAADQTPVVVDFMLPTVHAMLARGRDSVSTSDFGTPGYMAPEQAEDGHLSQAADVFAFGRTIERLCVYSRRARFAGNSLENLVRRMTLDDPDKRPGTMRAVLQDLNLIARRE